MSTITMNLAEKAHNSLIGALGFITVLRSSRVNAQAGLIISIECDQHAS